MTTATTYKGRDKERGEVERTKGGEGTRERRSVPQEDTIAPRRTSCMMIKSTLKRKSVLFSRIPKAYQRYGVTEGQHTLGKGRPWVLKALTLVSGQYSCRD
jgi:hypothetical protein